MPLTIDVKEDWTKRKTGFNKDGLFRETGYTIAFAPDEPSALAALYAAGIFLNAPDPFFPAIICDYCQIEQFSFTLSRARVTYKPLTGPSSDNSNPLSQPPEIEFHDGSRSEVMDRDIFGNAILASNGQPPTGIKPTDTPTRFFTIHKNLAAYSPQMDVAYANKVNSANWAPMGMQALLPGQCKCISVLPTIRYSIGVKYIPVAFSFEFAQGVNVGYNKLWDAFFLRFLDKGSKGWTRDIVTNKNRLDHFVYQGGAPIQGDQLLNGKGQPAEPDVKIGGMMPGEWSNPIDNPTKLPKQVFVDPGTDVATYLVYQNRFAADFNAFGF